MESKHAHKKGKRPVIVPRHIYEWARESSVISKERRFKPDVPTKHKDKRAYEGSRHI